MMQDKCRIACCFKARLFEYNYNFILFSKKINIVGLLLQIYVCGPKTVPKFWSPV